MRFLNNFNGLSRKIGTLTNMTKVGAGGVSTCSSIKQAVINGMFMFIHFRHLFLQEFL